MDVGGWCALFARATITSACRERVGDRGRGGGSPAGRWRETALLLDDSH